MKSSSEKEKVLKLIRNSLLERADIPYPELDMDSDLYNSISDDPVMVFAEQVVEGGGKFIYCQNESELINKLSSLITYRNWKEVTSYNKNLNSYLAANGLHTRLLDTKDTEVGLILCHSIDAKTGSIVITSNQGIGKGLLKFPPIFIIISYTSQITTDLKICLNNIAESTPEWVTMIKSNNLLQEEIKELYIFTVEDINPNN